jgi:hypothetical protein
MSNFPHGAFVAIHAAEEKRRRAEEEEEEMTSYTTEDLENKWEFKIVRSEIGAFRKPEVFQNLLQEEQIAGWEMVEKLDDRRVRFKRHKDARRKDTMLPQGYDPYRTTYGRSTAKTAVLIGIALAIALTVGIGILGAASTGGSKTMIIFPIIIMVAVGVLVFALAWIRRR